LYLKTLVSLSYPLGTEPWSFYFINGFLNFNVAFILALLVLPLTCLMECLLQKFHGECKTAVRAKHKTVDLKLLSKGRACLPKNSFPLLEVKLGSGKVFGIIAKFLELITHNGVAVQKEHTVRCIFSCAVCKRAETCFSLEG